MALAQLAAFWSLLVVGGHATQAPSSAPSTSHGVVTPTPTLPSTDACITRQGKQASLGSYSGSHDAYQYLDGAYFITATQNHNVDYYSRVGQIYKCTVLASGAREHCTKKCMMQWASCCDCNAADPLSATQSNMWAKVVDDRFDNCYYDCVAVTCPAVPATTAPTAGSEHHDSVAPAENDEWEISAMVKSLEDDVIRSLSTASANQIVVRDSQLAIIAAKRVALSGLDDHPVSVFTPVGAGAAVPVAVLKQFQTLDDDVVILVASYKGAGGGSVGGAMMPGSGSGSGSAQMRDYAGADEGLLSNPVGVRVEAVGSTTEAHPSSSHVWLAEPILVTISGQHSVHVPAGKQPTCIFWNETLQQWSHEGVVWVPSSDDSLVCSTMHLTVFSVVLKDIPKVYVRGSECISAEVMTSEGLASIRWYKHWLFRPATFFLLAISSFNVWLIFMAMRLDRRHHQQGDFKQDILFTSLSDKKATKDANPSLTCCARIAELPVSIIASELGHLYATKHWVSLYDLHKLHHECKGKLMVRLGTRSLTEMTPEWIFEKKRCPNGHSLQRAIANINECYCDVCGQVKYKEAILFGCRFCDYDQCESCYKKGNATSPLAHFRGEQVVFNLQRLVRESTDRGFWEEVIAEFNAVNPVVDLWHFSILHPSSIRALELAIKTEAAFMVCALFLQNVTHEGTLDWKSRKDVCIPDDVALLAIEKVWVGICSTVVSSLPMMIVSSLNVRQVVFDDNWTHDKKLDYIRQWKRMDLYGWTIGPLFCIALTFYNIAFLANVTEKDQYNWLVASMTSVALTFLITPVALSVGHVAVVKALLYYRPDWMDKVKRRWGVVEDAAQPNFEPERSSQATLESTADLPQVPITLGEPTFFDETIWNVDLDGMELQLERLKPRRTQVASPGGLPANTPSSLTSTPSEQTSSLRSSESRSASRPRTKTKAVGSSTVQEEQDTVWEEAPAAPETPSTATPRLEKKAAEGFCCVDAASAGRL